MSLRTKLDDIKKLDSSATTYFNKIKVLADKMTSIDRPLRDEEFADYVIKGLDAEYDNLAEDVQNAKPPIPSHELYSHLLFTESSAEPRRSSATIAESSRLLSLLRAAATPHLLSRPPHPRTDLGAPNASVPTVWP
ncbi:hypothetical protein ZWY2020_020761 [Hordeum vulgare]|nr:hypothetical protein ZWY2020_020761 [Hordeum vulgare]